MPGIKSGMTDASIKKRNDFLA